MPIRISNNSRNSTYNLKPHINYSRSITILPEYLRAKNLKTSTRRNTNISTRSKSTRSQSTRSKSTRRKYTKKYATR